MKGRGNYLCRKKLYDLTSQPVLNGLEEISHFRIISEWEKTTETGDRAELAELPESEPSVAEARRAHRPLHRLRVPAVRPLLHHRDAPPRCRERHHHRQSSSVLRRSRDQSGSRSRAGCRCPARRRGGRLRRGARTGRRCSRLLRRDRIESQDRGAAARCGKHAAPRRHSVCGRAARIGPRARTLANVFLAHPSGRRPLRLREPRRVSGRERRRVSGLQNALLHLYTELQAIPKKPDEVHALARRVDEAESAARLHAGGARAKHGLLDRAPRRPAWRAAQCISAGHADHRVGDPAQQCFSSTWSRQC